MKRILICDDEANLRDVLKMLLEDDGYAVDAVENGGRAVELLEAGTDPDLVISDLKMPRVDGMALLEYLRKSGRAIPLVMITAYGSIETAVEAMKRGAVDFITKPFNKDVIRHVVHTLLKSEDLKRENLVLRDSCIRTQGVVCQSAAMREIMDTIGKVAPARSTVLLLGESGTGKEVVARALHAMVVERAASEFSVPFVSINCPAVPDTLLESELFGYRKGAFTGAAQDFTGKIALAKNGILFLDEIAEIPLKTQAKLLRFIEEKTFEPLGSTSRIRIDARIVCATNRDLSAMVREGQFREDLFYRINTITIRVPPLRERPDDVLPLAEHFLAEISASLGKPIRGICAEVQGALKAYPWPGNARELRNIIERAVVLSSSDVLLPECLPPEMRRPHGADPGMPRDNRLEQAERDLLARALQSCGGNISAAARELGVSRDTIRYRMRKHGLQAG